MSSILAYKYRHDFIHGVIGHETLMVNELLSSAESTELTTKWVDEYIEEHRKAKKLASLKQDQIDALIAEYYTTTTATAIKEYLPPIIADCKNLSKLEIARMCVTL